MLYFSYFSYSCMRVPVTVMRSCGLFYVVAPERHCGSLSGQSLNASGDRPTGPACTRGRAARMPPCPCRRMPVTDVRRRALLYILALPRRDV